MVITGMLGRRNARKDCSGAARLIRHDCGAARRYPHGGKRPALTWVIDVGHPCSVDFQQDQRRFDLAGPINGKRFKLVGSQYQ